MGKFKQGLSTAALRTGNTIATPLRRGGEGINAVANIPRQGMSSIKNTKEVQIQSLNALLDNFLNFSKVKGKWYQRLVKVPINFASAVTRRPMMIGGANMLSSLNQGVRQPFKKLLYTPGKMFKGMRNATRIFSKKKGFDFQTYETHETTGDTRVNKIKEKGIGFLGVKPGAASGKQTKEDKPSKEEKQQAESKPKEENKEPEKKPEDKKIEKPEEKIIQPPATADKPASTPSSVIDKPKSIDDIKAQQKAASEKKDKEEQDKKFPQWNTLDDAFKKHYRKEYNKTLKNNPTRQGIIARGKEAKMGDTPEEIMKNFKEKDPTFVGYMEEILKKTN